MKHLLIIGAGGFGREIYNMARHCRGYGEDWDIKGYLDDTPDPLVGFKGYPPVIGKITEYIPQEDDVFTCAIGSVQGKRKCVESILARGGEFINLIHNSAIVNLNATLGRGCVVLRGVSIGCDSHIGDYVSIQAECMLGHDSTIGSWCHLHPRAFMGGWSKLQEEVYVGYGAFIHPRKNVGNGATVAAGAYVFRNVKPGTTVSGNPAVALC